MLLHKYCKLLHNTIVFRFNESVQPARYSIDNYGLLKKIL